MSTKAAKFSISLTSEQHAAAQAGADREHGGNLSRYFQALVARAEADEADILIALARRFAPVLRKDLEQLLQRPEMRQDLVMLRLLEAAADALRRGVDLQAPFEIFGTEEKFREAIRQSPAIFSALQAVAESAGAYGSPVIPNSPVNPAVARENKRRAAREGAGRARAKQPDTPAKAHQA